MIQKEKLVQFYFSQYKDSAMALKKKNNDGKKTYEQRIGRLITEMQRTKTGKLTQPHLEEYHRQIRNMAYYALKQKNQYAIMQIRDILMPELVRLDIGTLREEEQELVTSRLLEYLRTERPGEICQHPMRSILKNFAENGIRSQIIDMVPTRPEMEFPRALEMKRHFILHVGPTNCGKIYQALQRLRTAYKGIYLGPLRLLALEVYEKMRESGVPCTMLTGEERIYEENSRVISSTVEMLDIDQVYDVAVIDEAQMIADSDRGHSWTRGILGIQCPEIHICMSPAAQKVVTHLIELCGDTFEIRSYERKTALVCEEEPFDFPDDVRAGDALIVFTKRAVLDIAGRLERQGIRTSVIYGSLPPEIRRRQIRMFSAGGRELTCCVLDGKALPIVEIAPKEGFYDYKNKYQAGSTIEICPAPIGEESTRKIQKISERVFDALRLHKYARMDFMMDEAGNAYCLEANTLPGMTPTSLIPQEAAAVGISYDELCQKILDMAFED